MVVVSHKLCWPEPASATGIATDGGFPMQMRALATIVDQLVVCVPVDGSRRQEGGTALAGPGLTVVPLRPPRGRGVSRKLLLVLWTLWTAPRLAREIHRADAVHVPIPGDVGTIGIVIAEILRKPLFVRHCGNWFEARTRAERVWRWYMERWAGGRRVMMATGGGPQPPSTANPDLRWIFSTSLTADEMRLAAPTRTNNSSETFRLAIVCRQVRPKGTSVVIEALANLRASGDDVELDVIGDGPDLDEFRSLTSELDLDPHVTFHGNVPHDEVLRLLGAADLFVFPTRSSEGFPKAVLEAMACGLPVVATPVSVLPTLVGDGAGVVVPEAAPGPVASAIAGVIRDPAAHAAMSRCARSRVEGLTLEHWAEEIGATLAAAWGADVWQPGAQP